MSCECGRDRVMVCIDCHEEPLRDKLAKADKLAEAVERCARSASSHSIAACSDCWRAFRNHADDLNEALAAFREER